MINTNFSRDVLVHFVHILPLLKASVAMPGTVEAEHFHSWINQLNCGMKTDVDTCSRKLDRLLQSPAQKASFAYAIEGASSKNMSTLIDYCHRIGFIYMFCRQNYPLLKKLQCSFNAYKETKQQVEEDFSRLVVSLEALTTEKKAEPLRRPTPVNFVLSPQKELSPHFEVDASKCDEEPIQRCLTPMKGRSMNDI